MSAAACEADNPHAGAPAPRAAGPTIINSPSLPPLASRPVLPGKSSKAVHKPLQELTDRVDIALARNGDRSPQARLRQKPAAGNQLLVSWVLGLHAPDPGARDRVRTDIVTVLRLVRASQLKYGSVLFLATGSALEHGKRKISIVVRAKYTENLVRQTDWTHVSPSEVLGMCDDKPAVIAPGYR